MAGDELRGQEDGHFGRCQGMLDLSEPVLTWLDLGIRPGIDPATALEEGQMLLEFGQIGLILMAVTDEGTGAAERCRQHSAYKFPLSTNTAILSARIAEDAGQSQGLLFASQRNWHGSRNTMRCCNGMV